MTNNFYKPSGIKRRSRGVKALITFIISSIGVVSAHWIYLIAANIYDNYLCGQIPALLGYQFCFTVGVILSMLVISFFVIIPCWWLIRKKVWGQHLRDNLKAGKAWDEVVREIRNK